MRIGEVAAAVRLDPQTIRYYERRGLLPEPQRDPSGYRTYDHSVITRLQFIRAGQGVGFTLVEIASILDLRGDGVTPCTHVRDLLSTKLRDVRTRQDELAILGEELEGLISRSDQLDPVDCADTDSCHVIPRTTTS